MGVIVQNPGVATFIKVESSIAALRAYMNGERQTEVSPFDALKVLEDVDLSGISEGLRDRLQDVLYGCLESEDSYIVMEAFKILTKEQRGNLDLLRKGDSIVELAQQLTRVPIGSALGDSLNIRVCGLVQLYECGATNIARERIIEMLADPDERPRVMRHLFGTVEACDKGWLNDLIDYCEKNGYPLSPDIQRCYKKFCS
ncbi:MAG: hypothetical protein GYA55_14255 [SAR324 cluster bacterium]|uniref:Uncharacterized protein n=1 Tax=SAR324 cluster bacterium TaxID=2024889 RepID=A0A7X9FUX4_9DELT|nr:hypothetical protein [SAR324 cluster bacterium]